MRGTGSLLAVGVMSAILALATSYPGFRYQLPNGFNVPNPCDEDDIWQGVGHENKGGAGPKNQFGLDFQDAVFEWTNSLCMNDSDGDGLTNGQELGDPGCDWTIGDTPSRTSGITHPGIDNDNAGCSTSPLPAWLRRLLKLLCPRCRRPS